MCVLLRNVQLCVILHTTDVTICYSYTYVPGDYTFNIGLLCYRVLVYVLIG